MSKVKIIDTDQTGATVPCVLQMKMLCTNEPFRARHVSASRCLCTQPISAKTRKNRFPRSFTLREMIWHLSSGIYLVAIEWDQHDLSGPEHSPLGGTLDPNIPILVWEPIHLEIRDKFWHYVALALCKCRKRAPGPTL
jgi:hypothetical protein